MANVTITINNADVADTISALEQQWRAQAINFTFGGDSTAYDAATTTNKGKALLAALLRAGVRNYRRQQAEQAISVTAPDVT